MITYFKLASCLAMGFTVIPCWMFALGTLGHEMTKWLMLFGTVLWFLSTPWWMGVRREREAA
jgi:hypothetical protein